MKNKVEKNNSQKVHNYGLLSMMAMIIGIVISSGIFFKGESLTGINGSVLDSSIAWLVTSFLVIAILIAFIEIISITEINGEQASVTNWGRRLISENFGKFIGYYMTLVYFPLIIVGLFIFAGNSFLSTLEIAGWVDPTTSATEHMLSVTGISIIFLFLILGINSFFSKPGKYFQNIGTVIKTLPLFFIIFLFVYMLIANGSSINFNQDASINQAPEYSGIPDVALILMTIPPILFAFDGFLLAGALSKEAKSQNQFRLSLIISILFIVLIYVLFSLAVFGLGDVEETHAKYGTINNAIYASFDENVADIIAPVVSGIITLSILTGVSGCSIASGRMISDLSASNSIKDENAQLLKRNKFGVSYNSGLLVFLTAIIWFFIAISFDSFLAAKLDRDLIITGYMTDLIVIGAFLIYTIIIIFAIINRFKKKVEVKKIPGFLFFAIVSSSLMLIVTIWFAFTTIVPFGEILNPGLWDDDLWSIYYVKLAFFALFIFYILLISAINFLRIRNLPQEIIDRKNEQLLIFYPDFETSVNVKNEKKDTKTKEKIDKKDKVKEKEVKKSKDSTKSNKTKEKVVKETNSKSGGVKKSNNSKNNSDEKELKKQNSLEKESKIKK